MKKSKISVGILSGLLAVGALAACSKSGPEYSSKGVILTYELNGKKVEYTADSLFGEKVLDPEHAEEMFNQVYKLVVRNYFTIEDPDGEGTDTGSNQMAEINRIAEKNVKNDEDTAEKNAKTNSTSTKAEFESILNSHGCKDRDELKAYYVFEEQQTKFKENFYNIYADESNGQDAWVGYNLLRDGLGKNDADARNPDKFSGYLQTKVPYHVSHILVNVEDSASNNYSNGTISVDNVEHIKRVVDGLIDPTKSFGTVASEESDDTSKDEFGDLGIVDKEKADSVDDSKFVKEFILGLYTYDNIYTTDANVKAHIDGSVIDPDDTILGQIKAEYGSRPGFISIQDLQTLYESREVEGSSFITSSSSNFYPRNIYYNHLLNNHGVSLIVNNAMVNESTGDYIAPYTATTLGNFKVMDFQVGSEHCYKAVLCARGTDHPVLVTRAGASYQGIHFIVVNRSPFEGTGATMPEYATADGVKLSQYYTTKTPTQTGYPFTGDDSSKKTFVNPANFSESKYQERADKVDEAIKGFDTSIERFIYKKYLSKGYLDFTEAGKGIKETINKWIERKDQERSNSTHDSWEEYWTDYVDVLKMQKEAAGNKLKKGCAQAFKAASEVKTKTAWDALDLSGYGTGFQDKFEELFGTGGACNDGSSLK